MIKKFNIYLVLLTRKCSAFYDGNVQSGNAGDFLFNTVVPSLKNACPGKKVFITEYVSSFHSSKETALDFSTRSGWPSRGPSNGAAAASVADERSATISLNCASLRDTSVSVYGFEADDQLWKDNDNERSFGLFNKIVFNGDVLNAC